MLDGGHAEPVIGRASARPGGFARPTAPRRPDEEQRLRRVSKDEATELSHGLKNAGSLSALIMTSTMSAAPWSSRSSRSSHILRRLARIGAFSEGSRSIRVRAMQKAMPSVPIRACSTVGLLMAGSLSDLLGLLAPLLDQIAAQG